MNVWMAVPLAQGSLRKVLNTWKDIFPDAMLAAVSRQIGIPVVGINFCRIWLIVLAQVPHS